MPVPMHLSRIIHPHHPLRTRQQNLLQEVRPSPTHTDIPSAKSPAAEVVPIDPVVRLTRRLRLLVGAYLRELVFELAVPVRLRRHELLQVAVSSMQTS